MLLNEEDGIEIKRMREEQGISYHEGRQIRLRIRANEIIDNAESIEDLKIVLKAIVMGATFR
jgi:hypothetical protein